MAKTVAEIDGDSSGLVSELGKAKTAMGKVGDSGKKLSDQLKEVGDQADIAAGNLVNKLGGPGAIKAIGGATIAFAAAQQGVQMFLDSSEKLFRAYGEEGQAVWDDLEKQLFDIQGAFAKAVLQTDDMYVAAGRLYAALQLIKDMSAQAVDSFIIAINILRKIPGTFADSLEKMGLFEAFDAMAQEGEARARELTANMEKVNKSFEKPVAAAKTLTETVDEMTKSYAGLAGSAENVEEKQRKQALANIDNTVKQVEALALLQNMADNMSGDNVGGLTDAQFEQLERLGKLREQIVAEGEKKGTPAATGGGGGGKEKTPEEIRKENLDKLNASLQARLAEKEALAELRAENDANERELADEALKRAVERMEEETNRKMEAIKRVNDFAAQMLEEHNAELHAQGKLTEEEQKALDEERLKAVQDRTAQELSMYMQTAGKQIALGKLSAKAAADMARSQLGNVIIGLGDKAMAEAGILAAGLNPMAIPMAAAGVAAYAIGNAMMPTAKPSGTTPATEKAEAAAPASNNYAFNLRVDSVFADGESVARQFAMMQESARQRGLLQQGAY
jgi:hypothetical protein